MGGEEPLPAGGSCLLGAVNLSEFVKNPFTSKAEFDFNSFKETVKQSVIALNEVLDEGINLHPLQQQKDSVKNWRQIGLGLMGISDMFIKLNIKYGSQKSLDLSGQIGHTMINTALQQSALLAKDYGSYPMYNKEAILKSQFFNENATRETRELVEKYGLRNSQLLTIAPTGSISTMLGVSGGIEPIYSLSYTRKTESLYGKDKYYKVYTSIVKEYMKKFNIQKEEDLPDFFVTALTLNYQERVKMQATWQKYIDASISSTINLPENTTIEDIENIYILAWKKGLKGITIYREGCKRSGILSSNQSIKQKGDYIKPRPTLKRAEGERVKIPTGCGSLWLFLMKDENGNLREVFSQSGANGGCQGLTEGVSRMISLALKSNIDPQDIIDQLSSVRCPVSMMARKKNPEICKSCTDSMAKEIQKFINGKNETKIKQNNLCPECGNELKMVEGCISCDCGFSKCG